MGASSSSRIVEQIGVPTTRGWTRTRQLQFEQFFPPENRGLCIWEPALAYSWASPWKNPGDLFDDHQVALLGFKVAEAGEKIYQHREALPGERKRPHIGPEERACPPAGGVSQERQRKIYPRGPDVSAGEGCEVASMSAAEIEDSISRLDAKPLGGEGSLRLGLLIASRRVEGSVVFVEVLAIPVGIG